MKHIVVTMLTIVMALSCLWGCKKINENPQITSKLASGQALSPEEQKEYERYQNFYKGRTDEYKEREARKIYKEATAKEIKKGKRKYYRRDSGKSEFNITPEKCEPFGFKAGTKVVTNKGVAYVVGVKGGELWFHIQGEDGAAYWEGWGKENFAKAGFYDASQPPPNPSPQEEKVEEKPKESDPQPKEALVQTEHKQQEDKKEAPPAAPEQHGKAGDKVGEITGGPVKMKKLQPIPPIPALEEE